MVRIRAVSIFASWGLAFAFGAACDEGEGGPDAGVDCFVGDESLGPELQLIYRTIDGTYLDLADDEEVPLILPPQGGQVILIGARLRNVNICGMQMSALLRDTCTNRILGREGRPIHLEKNADGWAVPIQPDALDNYVNINACPNLASSRDIDQEPYQVELRAVNGNVDLGLQAQVRVLPVCAEASNVSCECQCDGDYVLGRDDCFNADAGSDLWRPDPDTAPGTCPEASDGGINVDAGN